MNSTRITSRRSPSRRARPLSKKCLLFVCALGCSRHLRLAFVSLPLHRDDRSIFRFNRYLGLIIVSLFAVGSPFNTERLRALLILKYVCCYPLVRTLIHDFNSSRHRSFVHHTRHRGRPGRALRGCVARFSARRCQPRQRD